ncbi:MAG: type VI secretion system tip protein VgrG [Desulfobulbaceae bacterium]|nr:type VI secretion system tip protein VgrG [Desulfobulbaceae bacterium]
MSNGSFAYTQENRIVAIESPLGADVLLLTGFRGLEGISSLFSFELELFSEHHNINFADIVGENVTVSIYLADGSQRYLNGIICRFCHGRGGGETGTDTRFSSYNATMVPWFWLLTRTADSRIFQNKNVPDIIEQVFSDQGFSDYSLRLHGSYEPKEYAVQYRETDFNFISRLMEEEGIHYFFEHERGKHVLVLADSPGENKPCPQQEEARYEISGSGLEQEDVLTHLEVMKEIRSGKYCMSDFNFKTPGTNLEVSVNSRLQLGPGEREIYDYPGEYYMRNAGDWLANVRMEEEEAQITTIRGNSRCRSFTSGFRFRLIDYFRDDMNQKEFLLTRIIHDVNQQGSYKGSGAVGGQSGMPAYTNTFECIPHEVPFRPVRLTAKPVVEGVQTAIVVGPSGEEIYTDEYGRVKVQFHWDREGKKDENSSCWIRVSQLWAGTGWGAMWIPRIGHEVIVDFVEGDPDRPIITGRVYHGTNMPPYKLPAEKTKSTIKSYSSPGGEGFNEIRFEDKKGEEQLFIHAEKKQDVRVKEDSLEWIGLKRHLIINDEQLELVESNKHLTVKGDHNEKVDGTISIETSMDLQEKIGMKHAVDAGQEIHLKAGMNVVLEAGTSITIKAGGGFIVVGPAGVTISGTPVLINSGGSAGSGSGCSPATPSLPDEADNAQPGEAVQMEAADAESTSAQAQTLASAAKSGTPFCDT